MPERKRYALIGTGGRSVMFLDALAGAHKDESELVAIGDPSQTRMQWQLDRMARQFNFAPVPTYSEKDFDRMIREKKPDAAIVTTPDSTAWRPPAYSRSIEAGSSTPDAPSTAALWILDGSPSSRVASDTG